MDYDDILKHLGEKGKWNIVSMFLLWMGPFIAGFTVLVYSFTGLEPEKFRCVIPQCDDHVFSPSFDDVSYAIFPEDDDDERDFCKYYPPRDNATRYNCARSTVFDLDASPVECKTEDGNFIYDEFELDSTVVTEWDLVCDDQFMVALVGSIYMCGILAGSFVFGFLGDILGRRWALMIAIVTTCVCGFGGAFVNHYSWYCVTRFFTGMGAQGCMVVSFIMAVELAGKETRTAIGINMQTPFAIGESVVSLVGIRVKDWRNFQIWTSVPLLIALSMFLVIPESPRWLLKTKKEEEFKKVVHKGAKMNKATIPEALLESEPKKTELETAEERNTGISAIFATPNMTRITIVMWINWIVVTVGYYGISLGIGDIGPDVFINFLLISLVELPSYVFATLTVDHIGRKALYIFCIMLTGVGCLAAAFLEDGNIFKTILCLIGKFGAAAAFAIVFLYAGELYPTEIRSSAVGLCSTLARIGGIAAPEIALYFPEFTFDAFPMLFMGGFSIFGGFLALMLPETLGQPLVESIEDVDDMFSTGKSLWTWWSSEQVEEHLQERTRAKQLKKQKQLENGHTNGNGIRKESI